MYHIYHDVKKHIFHVHEIQQFSFSMEPKLKMTFSCRVRLMQVQILCWHIPHTVLERNRTAICVRLGLGGCFRGINFWDFFCSVQYTYGT